MTAYHLGDMRRQAAHDGVGDEDPSEVVRLVAQALAGGVGDPRGQQGLLQGVADRRVGHQSELAGGAPLDSSGRDGFQLRSLGVVGADQGDAPGGVAYSADDRAEHVGEFRADQQEAFLVGLGRGDLQEGGQLAGGWQPVLGDAVVA